MFILLIHINQRGSFLSQKKDSCSTLIGFSTTCIGFSTTCIGFSKFSVVIFHPKFSTFFNDMPVKVRTELSWASTISMSQIARLGGGGGAMTCHGIEHALRGLYDITHGEGLAALLPVWMRHFYNVDNSGSIHSAGMSLAEKMDSRQRNSSSIVLA